MSLVTDYNLHFVKKAYCKNCKWNDMVWISRCFSVCNLKPEPGKVFAQEEVQESANHFNDCPQYKRKWWKVWVR